MRSAREPAKFCSAACQVREDIQDVQISHRELAGERMAPGIVRGNGPALFQSSEVLRIFLDFENGAALMDVAGAVEKVKAAERSMVVVKQPDADPSHIKRIRGDRGDPGKRLAQAGGTGARDFDQGSLEAGCIRHSEQSHCINAVVEISAKR
jgi:hypothetical protein